GKDLPTTPMDFCSSLPQEIASLAFPPPHSQSIRPAEDAPSHQQFRCLFSSTKSSFLPQSLVFVSEFGRDTSDDRCPPGDFPYEALELLFVSFHRNFPPHSPPHRTAQDSPPSSISEKQP